MAAMFPRTIALLRARFTRRRPGAAANGGQSLAGNRQDARLAVEMFNGRRTVRCQQCKTHLYVPPTSAQNPSFRCKVCWHQMVDPLFAPARSASSSEGSSASVATVHGRPHEASDINSKVGDSDSDVCSETSEKDVNLERVGTCLDVSVREKKGDDDHDWILLGRASSTAAPNASVMLPKQLEDDNSSISGRVNFVSDSDNTAIHMEACHVGRASKCSDDDLVMIPNSPTRNSNAAFFDDDVELVECFYGDPSLT